MPAVLLIQLPIPQINYGRRTANIPLAGACLRQAAARIPDVHIHIVPERVATYLGDGAILDLILYYRPQIIGFSVYCWNMERSLYLAGKAKEAYRPRILFGGPEVTPDNPAVHSWEVDLRVYGEGEAVFGRLLQDDSFWNRGSAALPADAIFRKGPSPYLEGILEPEIEDLVLLETQRGCPYGCGYCYYGKSRGHVSYKDGIIVLEAVRWAIERQVGELYLLDPSLNTRPRLHALLKDMGHLNKKRRLSIISEIRAEAVNESLASILADAGFTWLEIGLQSTNPVALGMMKRPMNHERFLRGIRFLKERKIITGIDLMAGLPGDDLKGFKRTVDFVVENQLQEDIQVFPLAVLPGTDFRLKSQDFGLQYTPEPPYTIIETPTFRKEDMLEAFDYAEKRLDCVLYPPPDLEISWRNHQARCWGEDIWVRVGNNPYISKLFLDQSRPVAELEESARQLTHPYQIFIGPMFRDEAWLFKALQIITWANPFIPFETVFLEPHRLPDTARLLEYTRLNRPHFLDMEQRYMYSDPGNRAVLFTLVTANRKLCFKGDMKRQVFWWRGADLPTLKDLKALIHLEGIVIDATVPDQELMDWQDRHAPYADDYLFIGFSRLDHQRCWLERTEGGEYYFPVMA